MARARQMKRTQPKWLMHCKSPLTGDCQHVRITSDWIVRCFKPSFHQMQTMYGNNVEAIVDGITQQHMPYCNIVPSTPGEVEFSRRLTAAVETLLRSPGSMKGDQPLWFAQLLEE